MTRCLTYVVLRARTKLGERAFSVFRTYGVERFALADKFHIESDDVLNASVFTIITDRFWLYVSSLIA